MAANGQLVFTDVDKVTFKGVGDTSNAVIDTTTGKIGVGVDSPDANLHVVGNCFVSTDFTASTLSGNGSGLTALNAANVTTGTLDRNTTGSAATLTTPRTIGGVNFDGSADIVPTTFGAATFDTDTLVVDSVNDRVGIGTTLPQAPFHVKPVNNNNDTENTLLDFRDDFSNHGYLGIFATETHTNAIGPDLRFKGAIYNNTANPTINQVMCLKPTGNVGIGLTDPDGTLHVKAGNRVHITEGTTPAFTGLESTSQGRAQLVLSSDYSDLVIASSRVNNAHGSTLSFTTVNPSNTADYRKFVINQGNWGARKQFLDFGYEDSSVPNPHVAINSTDTVLTLDGINKRVGIGTTSPACPFHVKFSTNSARSSGTRFEDANTTNYWENWINNGDYFYFAYNGSDRGWIQGPNGPAATKMPNFTGQHMTFIKDIPFIRATGCEGLIVSSDQNKYIKMNEGIEAGSNAITINESLPVVSLSNVTNDKKCFGVVSASEDPETRTVLYGAWGSVAEKEKGDTRVYINSVGEGAVWVTNINGSLEAGDYITTSNVVGYGQKQDDDILHNYTVAKITMDCDFEPVTQPIQIIKKEMGDVNYWVKTTYENVTEEEYSNLIDENRQIVEGDYQKITIEESKTEQEGYDLDVHQELVNILDEHGQLQWEDHPTETEKAYKIRYLDASGVETDEASAVHKAAFVGCTYHCG